MAEISAYQGDFSWFVSRVKMVYGRLQLERGECFELTGSLGDQKLIEHNYVAPLANPAAMVQCDTCGKRSVDAIHAILHRRAAHRDTRPVVDLDDQR